MSIAPIRIAALDALPHGFLGREGGVSAGIHAGLNVGLGSDDDRDAIHENRRRAVEAVAPGHQLVTLHQVHSPDALAVTAPFADEARPHADALVTDRPGLLLGILTADCVPVLFADEDAGVVGAAHAGWKGALHGVNDSTLAEMEKLGADRGRIVAAIGPCIARSSYEVAEPFVRFLNVGPDRTGQRLGQGCSSLAQARGGSAEVAQDEGQRVVDFVSNAGHQLAERGHFCGLNQLNLLNLELCVGGT